MSLASKQCVGGVFVGVLLGGGVVVVVVGVVVVAVCLRVLSVVFLESTFTDACPSIAV